jgi:hypothetical protein
VVRCGRSFPCGATRRSRCAIRSEFDGTHELPKHADLDVAVSGFKIHAAIDYGTYVVNETVADAVFAGV